MKNKKKYFISRFKILILDIPFSIVSFFLIRKPHIVFIDNQNKSFTSNSKSVFLFYLKEHKEIICKFVIDSEVERTKLISKYGEHFIKGKSLKDKLFILQSYVWVTSSMYTPLLGLFYNRRHLVLHLSHGSLFKRAGLAEKNVSFLKKCFYKLMKTNFSYFYISSNKLIKHACELYGVGKDKILVNSMPCCDVLIKRNPNQILDQSSSNLKVLYSPTWRSNRKISFFPFNDFNLSEFNSFLISKKIDIYLRPHPNFNSNMDNLLTSNIKLYDTNIEKDIYNSLADFDVLISDYSSISLDFMMLEKNTILIPYDLDEYEKDIGFFFDYTADAPGVIISTLSELKATLNRLSTDKNLVILNDNFIRMNQTINQYMDGNGSMRCANLINETLSKNFNLTSTKEHM